MGLIQNNQFNIGHICTRQQCEAGFADKVAMRWITQRHELVEHTFYDLESEK